MKKLLAMALLTGVVGTASATVITDAKVVATQGYIVFEENLPVYDGDVAKALKACALYVTGANVAGTFSYGFISHTMKKEGGQRVSINVSGVGGTGACIASLAGNI